MTVSDLDRRTFVVASGTTAATLLAGCTDSGGETPGDEETGDDGAGDETPADGDENGGDDGENGSSEYLEDEPNYDGWFDDVDNYEETLDRRDQDSVSVDVGSEGGLSFTPAAVAVSPGTTVTWEWTGEGGEHDVTHEDGDFESEQTDEAGHTFEHVFEEAGTYRYVCTPHETVGMKGAVHVQEQSE